MPGGMRAGLEFIEQFGERIGGAERDRTAGLLVANEALSQLSYSPTTFLSYQRAANRESGAIRME